MSTSYIFIDGSYFCIHRYHALISWWKHTQKDDNLDLENEEFINQYKKTFVDKLHKIPKMFPEMLDPIVIVGKDCKREQIWRNQLFTQYKANRLTDIKKNSFFKEMFKMNNEEELFTKGGVNHIIQHQQLEADDCIAIYVKHLLKNKPDCNINIITSDKDYLQLVSENVHIFDLSFKNIGKNKTSTGNPHIDLEIKIIMGDISDNIPALFPKCGLKTAFKYTQNPTLFQYKLNEHNSHEQYKLNKKLVDFDEIPENLVAEFYEKYKL
jgi:5'-3' exonuclease